MWKEHLARHKAQLFAAFIEPLPILYTAYYDPTTSCWRAAGEDLDVPVEAPTLEVLKEHLDAHVSALKKKTPGTTAVFELRITLGIAQDQ